jgi:Amt family ammonium transporter
VKPEAEIEGIDGDQHGEAAYDVAPGSGVLV